MATSVNSITFVATSNDVKATASVLRGTPIRDVLLQSRATLLSFDENSRKDICIIQSSEHGAHSEVINQEWGLVGAIVEAYNKHHRLILRPDDVWQTILTQFSFHVNANAEALRDCFVDFQGKKTLVIEMGGTLFSTNFGTFAKRMVDEKIAPNLKDAEVTKWLLPDFSTTTTNDRVAASVTIMSTLQAFFEYVCLLSCGIPEVTLEGTVDDWKCLRQKIDRLVQYDVKGKDHVMKRWHSLLVPVLDQFVSSAQGNPSLEFWDTICHKSGGGSGPRYLSGWVTVFACFKTNGTFQGDVLGETPGPVSTSSRSKRDGDGNPVVVPRPTHKWPRIETGKIPSGAVSVPVLVDDNGVQYDTQMIAGQFGFEMETDKEDTVRPRTDWCIAYLGDPRAVPNNYKDGEIKLPTKNPQPFEEYNIEK